MPLSSPGLHNLERTSAGKIGYFRNWSWGMYSANGSVCDGGGEKSELNDFPHYVCDAGVACRRVADGLAVCRRSYRNVKHNVR